MRCWWIAIFAACSSAPAPTTTSSPTTAKPIIPIAKPEPKPTPESQPAGTAEQIYVASLEEQRKTALIKGLVNGTIPSVKPLGLRALGRIGGQEARDVLVATLASPHEADVVAAAHAVGIRAMLDEPKPDPQIDAALAKLLTSKSTAVVAAAVDAIGRASAPEAQAQLVAAASQAPREVALAFGRYGRRKLALDEASRAALATLARSSDRDVRYAATWALSREHASESNAEGTKALLDNVQSPDAEIAATAIAGLARRKPTSPVRVAAGTELRDWRVAVELVRYHTREGASSGDIDHAIAIVEGALGKLAGEPPFAHVAMEGLRGLARHRSHRDRLATVKLDAAVPDLTRGWIECLATARALRLPATKSFAPLERCGNGTLPDHLRLPLLAGAIEAKAGTLVARRAALRTLLSHKDVRVKAAGLEALVALWPDGTAGDRRAAVGTFVSAIGSDSVLHAGAAVEAAEGMYAAMEKSKDAAHREALDRAIVARALTERDVELAASLYGLIGKRTLAAGLPACKKGIIGAPASAKAAAACLDKLGEYVPPVPKRSAMPADIDVKIVFGKQLVWQLETTRGRIDIELLPDRAPWAVAAIVHLAQKGFYDGLELHRVVPNFVAQGGDPTESGWGGPGFALPSEPSHEAGFVAGGVGIADAGRDSGGSQWFVMHASAPHLDGRYTYFGRVVAGQGVADALLIGDRVVKSTIASR